MKKNEFKKIWSIFPIIFLLILAVGFSKNRTEQVPDIPEETTRLNAGEFTNQTNGLPEEFKESIVVNDGFELVTSIASRDGRKVVYSEISDCIEVLNNYDDSDDTGCRNWEYNIFVKDLKSEQVRKIYSFPKDAKFSLVDIFIEKAYAGGCSLVHLPIAWSKNNQLIILKWTNLTDCGSGGAPTYSTYIIPAVGGKVEPLAIAPLFYDDYGQLISVEDNPNSEVIFCGPGGDTNSGRLIWKYIESGEIKILEEDNEKYFQLKSIDEDKKIIHYTAHDIEPTDYNCVESPWNAPSQEKQIPLP